MSLWGGRFAGSTSQLFKQFNDSLPFDYQLALEDIQGSIAWSQALHKAGVLTQQESQALVHSLQKLSDKVQASPEIMVSSGVEDIHTWVEQCLIAELGELGKKLHTGRSRNDQVSTDFRLWCTKACSSLEVSLKHLYLALVELAAEHTDTLFPGYTHLQRAQPISFGHWCLAYTEMLTRDMQRLQDAKKRIDVCPLGSGALAGTAFAIDRHALAESLGFSQISQNSLDAVSDRDFVLDLLYLASVSMMHLSRMAEDLIFYASGEAGLVTMSDSVSTGSSLMPQKKNPDAMELVRGKSGRVFGALQGMLVTLKGLPLAYNKDMQEDKEGLFDALSQWQLCLDVSTEAITGLTVNKELAYRAAMGGYSNSTELADYLVEKGVSFREAHHIVGRVVQLAIAHQQPIEDLPLEELQAFHPDIEQDVYAWLQGEAAIARRSQTGGTAPAQVKHQVARKRALDIEVRDATLDDLDVIHRLVAHWADQGENLPRKKDEIIRSIRDFVVAEYRGKVVACASLYIYGSGLAEVRSLGVDESAQGKGLGAAMVEHLLTRAKNLHIARVFALTRVPGFFASLGFTRDNKDDLPEKVMKDCELCPRLHACDEEALSIRVLPAQHKYSECGRIAVVAA